MDSWTDGMGINNPFHEPRRGGGRRSSQVALPPPSSAACSGATSVVGRCTVPQCGIPPALRAGTAQRAVLHLGITETLDAVTIRGLMRNQPENGPEIGWLKRELFLQVR